MTKKPTRTTRAKTKTGTGKAPARTKAKTTATSSGGTRERKRRATTKKTQTPKAMDEPKAKGTATPIRNGGESRPEQDRRGRFVKGNKGGPGRPKGVKDRLSLSVLQRLQERGTDVVEQVLNLAIEKGDVTAARLVLERLVAKADSQPIRWEFVTALETAEDIDKELTALLQGVAAGKITPGQSKYLRELLESKAEAIQRATMGDVRTAFEMDEQVLVQIRAQPVLFAAASRFVGLLGQFFLEQQHPVIEAARVIAAPEKEG